MSRVNFKKYSMFVLLICLAILVFGCDNKTPVKDIYFAHNEQIVMLVGEELSPSVVVTPTYASNTKYTITSSNTDVVVVSNNKLKAIAEGISTIKVVAKDNKLIEDMITVNVRLQPTNLNIPTGLKYISETQTISFDMVNNASNYILSVNGVETNLGNSNSITLENLNNIVGNAYDNLLQIKVKAKAPTYTKAFVDSEYSSTISVYQNSSVQNIQVVNGNLEFSKKEELVYDIYLNNEIWLTNQLENKISVDALDEKYAGKDVSLGVVAKNSGKSVAQGYYASQISKIDVTVIDVPTLNLNDVQVYWNSISKINSYKIFVDDVEKAVVNENHLKLSDLNNFNIETNVNYKLTVDPQLNNSINLAKTNKKSEINFNKLSAVNLSITNSSVKWERNSNASSYYILLKEENGETLVNAQTLLTEYSMLKYASGKNYTLYIKANGVYNSNENVYYISSEMSDLTFTKNAVVNLSISDYSLEFKSIAGENYAVKIDDSTSFTISADGDYVSYNLLDLAKNEPFSACEHEIVVYHLGNGVNSIDGDSNSISFVQLEKINSLSIENSIINVNAGEFNNDYNAKVKFIIKDDEDNEIYSIQQAVGQELNTLNIPVSLKEEDKYNAGNYNVYVQVLGTGNSEENSVATFSYMEKDVEGNMTIANCCSGYFEILPSPTLEHVNNEQKISFDVITGATGYNVYKDNEIKSNNQSETTYSFNLSEGSASFAVVACGNGITELDSNVSEQLVITRLNTPTLSFDNNENKLSKNDNNDSALISGYILEHTYNNGNEDISTFVDLSTWSFGSAFNELKEGLNVFKLKLNPAKENYLESNIGLIEITKITKDVDIIINEDNQLVVGPKNHNNIEFKLNLFVNLIEGNVSVDTSNLTYNFVNGKYYINLLNEDFTPILPQLVEDFNVAVSFASAQENTAKSDISDFTFIDILDKTTLSRNEQNVTFESVNALRQLSNYALLINGSKVIEISSIASINEQTITIPVNEIGKEVNAGEVNTLQVITKNNFAEDSSETLSVAGDKFKFIIEQTLELVSSKNNSAENNSVIISFETYSSSYDKYYNIYVYNNNILEDSVYVKSFEHKASDLNIGNVISFALDDISKEGLLNIVASVVVEGVTQEGEDYIYHFNSKNSNILQLQKAESVTNLEVKNGILQFTSIADVVGYEIYEKSENGYTYTKLAFETSNSYNLSTLTGTKELVVKAITSDIMPLSKTNSSYSSVIKVNKLETPQLSTYNGDIEVILSNSAINLLSSTSDDCSLVIKNLTTGQEKLFKINNDSVLLDTDSADYKALIISSFDVLDYGTTSLISENFEVYVKVNSTDLNSEIKYINSDLVRMQAYGLFAPINVEKTTDSNSNYEYIEFIRWQTNSTINTLNEKLLEGGYQFKITYQVGELTTTYYSTDKYLMWKDGETFKSYASIIEGTSCNFPYGYDLNKNGTISEDEKFGAGKYDVAVRIVPIESDTYNLCASKYSAECSFEIMETLELSTYNGEITWKTNSKATNYLVKIYERGTTEESPYVLLETKLIDPPVNKYVIDGKVGKIYGVQVQAINTNDNSVLNSAVSEIVEFYRLPVVENISVDDGRLYITANDLFTSAIIEFKDSSGNVETLIYINKFAEESLNGLKISSWQELSDLSVLNSSSTHVVTIDDSEILKLTAGSTFSINVKLIGNTSENLGIINSVKVENVDNLKITKLSTNNLFNVSKGVLTLTLDDDYSGDIIVNNNINNQSSLDSFLAKTPIFKIEVSAAGTTYYIYALDYATFEEARRVDSASGKVDEIAGKYEVFDNTDESYALGALHGYYIYSYNETESLFINVFKNNQINLRDFDYLRYYPITETFDANLSQYVWSGVSDSSKYETINLANGGTFVVKANLLGGDVEDSSAYLTSNLVESKTFVRYQINSISANNGLLRFADLKSDIDTPIYRLIVKGTTFTGNENVEKYVYLYQGDIETAKDIIGDDNGIYVEIKTEDIVSGYIQFDLSEYFEAGSYAINIKTLVGIGSQTDDADYLLDSKDPVTSYAFKQLQETEISASSGYLTFERSYVISENEKVYFDNYEITIINGEEEFVYQIVSTSTGVIVDESNNIIKYNIPSIIEYNGKTFTINSNTVYKIKVRPIVVDNLALKTDIVNGHYMSYLGVEKTFAFKMSTGSTSFEINNGKLQWVSNGVDDKFVIRLIYGDEDNKKVIVINPNTTPNGNIYTYEFTDGTYQIEGTNNYPYILSGVDYKVELRSYNSSISAEGVSTVFSKSLVIEKMNRLAKVDANSIIADDGILSWDAVDGVEKYTVVISDTYTFETSETKLDLSTAKDLNGKIIEAGNYTIKIRAIGKDKITAMNSNASSTFTLLGVVDDTSIRIGDDGDTLTWLAVDNADGYEVVVYYDYNDGIYGKHASKIVENSESNQTQSLLISSLTTNVDGQEQNVVINGKYLIKIRAVGIGESYALNGAWVEYNNLTYAPNPVSEIVIDEENYAYTWSSQGEMGSGDIFEIRYLLDGVQQNTTINYVVGTTEYSFPFTTIGTYSNFTVIVKRSGTLSSTARTALDYTFELYKAGSGTSEDPYQIETSAHLLNISKFTNKCFVLVANITLTTSDVSNADGSLKDGGIIASEFSGNLSGKYGNGNKYAIYFDFENVDNALNIENINTFALFGTLNEATISDVIIGKAGENSESSTKFINSFAIETANVLNLALVAGSANSSTITGVSINNIEYQITISTTVNEVYIAGLVGKVVGGTISNCSIDGLTIEFNANASSSKTHVAGLIAKAQNNVTISDLTVTNFAISQSTSTYAIKYAAGAVAYITRSNSTFAKSTISNVNVTMKATNFFSTYFGGVVASAEWVSISNATSNVTYEANTYQQETYFGGIAGYAYDVSMLDVTASVSISITTFSSATQYFGEIVGDIQTYSSIVGYTVDKSIQLDGSVQKETEIINNVLTLGVYGNSATGLTITK